MCERNLMTESSRRLCPIMFVCLRLWSGLTNHGNGTGEQQTPQSRERQVKMHCDKHKRLKRARRKKGARNEYTYIISAQIGLVSMPTE